MWVEHRHMQIHHILDLFLFINRRTNKKIEDMCNFRTKVSNWIEEHHTNKSTTPTGSYGSKPYLKSIEQPDFGRTISPIAMQSVLESEIEKVSGKIESLLGELGHLSDISDLTTPSHDNKQHLNVENQQVPPVANFQQPAQQVINRPQPVVNNHQQHKLPVTTDEMPSDHVLHFPPSVQHENLYRQQEEPIASHLQQASQAYHRSSPNLCTESSTGTQTTTASDGFHQPTTRCQQGSKTSVASSKECANATIGTRLQQRLAQLQLEVNNYAQPVQQQNPATVPVSLHQQQPQQQQPSYQQLGNQQPSFVPRTQPPIMIGHPTSMFQPPRGGPSPQAPTNLQSYNQTSNTCLA
ncbi:unnamed protein product [Mytilus coruscus]|uniref:Uncharacterized protein n=1 Tax=Mytilus coruscus TaxID=42192 RepID=A0A6J8ELL7_MYTCO|nr:unnamed protein product [Mytilus coruscus]